MSKLGLSKLSKKGRLILFSSLFVLLVSAFGLYYLIFSPSYLNFDFLNKEEQSSELLEINEELNIDDDCPDCRFRWLDGKRVQAELANSFPVAIMIDNDPLARPQAALSQALLVYEAPVEGRITRYLAVYPAEMDITKVGPVRSARPYFVSIAAELGAAYLHVGGSPDALEQIRAAKVYDLNEFYNEKYFWRDYNFPAPHNIFTNQEKWQSYLDNRGLFERQADSWLFKEDLPIESEAEELEVLELEIIFGPAFQVRWQYDQGNNEYLRIFNDQLPKDKKDEIRAKNVIVQEVTSAVLDKVGRLAIKVRGEGKALICLDASCETGFWKKQGTNRTRYYYETGDEVKLNPGVTWIELADSVTKFNY